MKSKKQDREMELKNQLARALADYDNLQKRVVREREDFVRIANLRLVLNLLSVIDELDAAQKHLEDAGLAISLQNLRQILAQEGFMEITLAPGEEFDSNLAEVIETVEGELSLGGKISEVVVNGWRTKDMVIRPAKVKVYKQKEQ